MAGVQIAQAKAPWVMFERRAEEDRTASIEQGRFVARDVDYALITPHGSKDQIERVVSEWFEHLDNEVKAERFPRDWLRAYKSIYEDWKEGREPEVNGTSILNWPVASPAQVRMLQDLKILSVEVLAEANEEAIRRMGMGGRDLVAKAREFLAQASGAGKTASQVVALEQRIAELTATVNQLQDANTQLALAAKNTAAAVDAATSAPVGDGIQTNDLLDPPAKQKVATKL